jgi:hypothetical protein
MQPEGEAEYFEAVVDSLIHKNLVDVSANGDLRLLDLVLEYLELKKPIDLVTILCDQEGELKQGKELLAVFLSIYGKQNVHVKMLLWRTGAVFNEKSPGYWLHELLDTNAENAILAIFQLYKATQQDAKALLDLMHGHEDQKLIAAKVLVSLMINVGGENLLVDGDIEKFVQLCIDILQKSSNFFAYEHRLLEVMLQMANCSAFAKKMICHKRLLILILERIEQYDKYLLKYVEILVALILYVQGIKNTRSEDVMREPMKLCVLDNTSMSHVLYHGENSSRGTKVPFFEPKSLFKVLQCLLQHIQVRLTSKDREEYMPVNWSCGIIRVLGCLVDITNGATHFVEYGGVELLFRLEHEELWDKMEFKDVMRLFCHKVIFERISFNGHISSLMSILKRGTMEDIIHVPWSLKCLAIGHEEVALKLITEVGVEKVDEAVELWEVWCPGSTMKHWLRHEGIAKGIILEGSICELLKGVIHQSSNMQPVNLIWIDLLLNMAQNKAYANKMVALGCIEMVADTLNHPINCTVFCFVPRLVRRLVEGFDNRLQILLSKICITDLLAIHEQLSVQGINEFTFLPKALVITKRIAMDLLARNHHTCQDFYILLDLAKSHEEIASLIASSIATNDKIMKELFSKCYYQMCVELLSPKLAISREKKIKSRQI